MKVKIKNGYLVIRIPLADITSLRYAEAGGDVPKVKAPKLKPVTHTEECIVSHKLALTFDRQWPAHCRTCGAKGFIPGPGGQKRTCPRCLEFNICPRCGSSALGKVSTEDGTYAVCDGGENACGWSQAGAFSPAAEAAGLIAPVWRCNCSEKEDTDAGV